QQHLARVQRRVDDEAGIGHVPLQPRGVTEVLFRDRRRVGPAAVVDLGEQLVLLAERQFELLAEDAGVEQILNADSYPRHLVAVGRADATARRADPGTAQVAFTDLV